MVDLGIRTVPVQLMSGLYNLPVCSKRVWAELVRCKTDEEYTEICGALLKDVPLSANIPAHDRRLLAETYRNSIERICEELELGIPYYKTDPTDDAVKYDIYTTSDKLAADYANMNIYEIDDIPILDYRLILRDAFISKLSQTDKGKEYLKNAYRLTQTEADEEIG